MSYVINRYRQGKPDVDLPVRYNSIADARQAVEVFLLTEVQQRMSEEEVRIKWFTRPDRGRWRVIVTFGGTFTYTDFLCYEILPDKSERTTPMWQVIKYPKHLALTHIAEYAQIDTAVQAATNAALNEVRERTYMNHVHIQFKANKSPTNPYTVLVYYGRKPHWTDSTVYEVELG